MSSWWQQERNPQIFKNFLGRRCSLASPKDNALGRHCLQGLVSNIRNKPKKRRRKTSWSDADRDPLINSKYFNSKYTSMQCEAPRRNVARNTAELEDLQ
jgi:hypothetical protein